MFNTAFQWLLTAEGGEANLAADRGGHTKYGISDASDGKKDGQADLDRDGTPDKPISELTIDDARKYYLNEYWLAAGCRRAANVHAPLAIALFDCAVHSGPVVAVRLLQQILGVTVDGQLGPKTMNTLARETAKDSSHLLLAYLEIRAKYLLAIIRADPSQWPFAHGWLNRLLRLQDFLHNKAGRWE